MEEIDDIFAGKELDEGEEKGNGPVREGDDSKHDENRGGEKETEPMRAAGENAKKSENGGGGKDGRPIEDEETLKRKGNEAKTKENAPIGVGKDPKDVEKTYRGKRQWVVLGVVGIFLLSGAGVVLLKYDNAWFQRQKPHVVDRYQIPKGQKITLGSFIIPLKGSDKFTYISLSITLDLPNKKVKEEMMGKKERMRGVLYDVLKEELNAFQDVPPVESLRRPIRNGINDVLSTGKVHDVYIEQFLAG